MAIPFLNNISLNNNEIQNVKLHNTGTIPSPAAGHIYFDTDDNIAKYYDGSVWIDIVANTNDFLTGLSFDDTNGILTATVSNQTDVTVDLDGRYALADDIPTNIVETVTTTDGTYINLTPNSPTDGAVTVTADLSAVNGTAAANERYLTKNNKWAEIATIPGTYNFNVTDGTNTTTIASGDTVTFLPTANETTVVESNGTITIGLPDNVTIAGTLTVIGTTITNNVETVSTSNGVVFEGNAADVNELTLLAGTLTGDQTITLPDATGTVALTSDLHDAVTLVGNYNYITLSGQELTLNQIDYATDITNLPAIPVPNNATITVNVGGGLTGGGDFTTDQAINETITVEHADTSSQASVDNSAVTVIQDVTLDTYGHVTALGSVDLTTGINNLIDTKISANGYAATITDSVSGTTFNHGLGDDVIVQLYDNTTKETVYADVERNGDYLNITFASTPTNSIRVLVQQIN
jgi:hypothetical protein